MARLRPFKRTRRTDDADSSEGSEPERPLQLSDVGQAAPPAELPPVEIAVAPLTIKEDSAEEAVAEEPAPEEPAAEEAQPEEQAEGKQRGRRKARPPRPPVANLSRVRRERRTLLQERERRIRDLGGLMLEMYRHDQFREDLIVEHCAQAMGVENRIHELESILTRAKSGRSTPGPQCACGAPLLFGARFCASCGRPTELATEAEHCARCRQPLAVGASFCASCGAAVAGVTDSNDPDEQTMEHAPPAEPATDAERGEGGKT
ncbi:MAG: double zinc ribbon domain-containing protein [Gaiellaceae bacterium]